MEVDLSDHNLSLLSPTKPIKERCNLCNCILSSNFDAFSLHQIYFLCCGALLCSACVENSVINGRLKDCCMFCNTTIKKSDGDKLNLCMDKASEINPDPKALCVLADCHLRGTWGLAPDIGKAIHLWNEAIQYGSSTASFNLGVLYCHGSKEANIDKDIGKAFSYFTYAAEGGNKDARRLINKAKAAAMFIVG